MRSRAAAGLGPDGHPQVDATDENAPSATSYGQGHHLAAKAVRGTTAAAAGGHARTAAPLGVKSVAGGAMGGGALRGGAKRTALGDVSNRQPLAGLNNAANAAATKPAGISSRPLRARDADHAAAFAPSLALAPAHLGAVHSQQQQQQAFLAPAADFRDDVQDSHYAGLQMRERQMQQLQQPVDLTAVQEIDLEEDLEQSLADEDDEDDDEDDDRTEISGEMEEDLVLDEDEDADFDEEEHYNEVAARPRSAASRAAAADARMELDPMSHGAVLASVGPSQLNAHPQHGRRHVPDGAVTEPAYTKSDRAELRRVADGFVDEWNEWEDISMVQEYADDIFAYMHALERRLTPSPDYMSHQGELEWKMRSILVDWLVQVHARFHLLPETLFLTINFIDRFLTAKAVSLQKLQLVGATALFLASKYEEIQCPSVSEIVYMVDNGYSADEILKAERFMIGMLDFELGWPGPMSFLRRISKADDYDVDTRTVAKYLLECMLMSHKFVACPPSFSAAVADYLARVILDKRQPWTDAHVFFSTYTERQVRPAADLVLRDCLTNARTHHAAVFEKYADRKQKKVSAYVEAWVQGRMRA